MKPHIGSKLTSLPMCGFIAQLVEHRTGIAEVTGSNPVEALIFFFQASSFQLLKLENLLRRSFFTLIYHRSSHMNYFIYASRHFTPHGRYELNKLTSLPMCGFIAQLVEHRTGIAEVMGSNPVEALIFFRLLLSNCLNWKIYCDDHSSLCIFFVDVIYLSAAEIINSKLKYMYVLLIWFSPLEEGVKLARNLLTSALLRLKKENS